MAAQNKVQAIFDLDGVLATKDLAHDVFEKHGFGDFFRQQSNAIADAANAGKEFDGIKAYPGQTLQFVLREAYVRGARIKPQELEEMAASAKLMRGARALVSKLKKTKLVEDVFIVSTTYKPGATVIGARLGIPANHVFATRVDLDKAGFMRYTVGPAIGGIFKGNAVEIIKNITGIPLNRTVVIGDSITDIGMMEKVVRAGGLGIAFNANPDLLKRNPTVVYAGRSLRPVFGLVTGFAKGSHKRVAYIVARNQYLRRLFPTYMNWVGRPHLYDSKMHADKAAQISAKWRAKVRGKKHHRLR